MTQMILYEKIILLKGALQKSLTDILISLSKKNSRAIFRKSLHL